MTVTPEETNAMKRILEMMDGNQHIDHSPVAQQSSKNEVELAGAGQVTQRDIDAMSMVLQKLNTVTQQVITESHRDPELRDAVETQRNDQGVKIGSYQIMIKEDLKRLAGKQYYSIYHVKSNDIIADDISLYETALTVAKLLNSGRYVNDSVIRKLFEGDDRYTAHKTDAMRFKIRARKCEKQGDLDKMDVYESRYQASISNAMAYKKDIKKLITEARDR